MEKTLGPLRAVDHDAGKNARQDQSSDQHVIGRMLCGDICAQRAFVARYERYIRQLLGHLRVPEQDRDDICQEVFFHLWNRDFHCLRQWQPKGEGLFRPYLRVVVTHVAYDYLRRSRSRVSIAAAETDHERSLVSPITDDRVDPERLVVCRAQLAAIRSTMQQLSARDARLLWHRHYLNKSYQEISMILGLKVGHVGVALRRATRRLSERLREQYPGLFESG